MVAVVGARLRSARSSAYARRPVAVGRGATNVRGPTTRVYAIAGNGVGGSAASDADAGVAAAPAPAPAALEEDEVDIGDGSNGSGDERGGGNGGGKGGGSGGGDDRNDGESTGDGGGGGGEVLLTLAQADVLRKGSRLPVDFLEAARCGALRRDSLVSFLSLQAKLGSLAWMLHRFGFIRDRLVYDDRFLFKMGVEVLIDSGCATFAEVQKRAEAFWDEIEFYASDMVVGCVLDCVLVTLLAPAAAVWGGERAKQMMSDSALKRFFASLPSAAAARGAFTAQQRFASFLVTGAQYTAAGFVAGIVGQTLANSAILVRRQLMGESTSSEDMKTQPVLKSAMVWAIFMGISSNPRYQTVYLVERMVRSHKFYCEST